MASALGVFGLIPFVCSSSAVLTFRNLNVERSDRWATHDVVGGKPKLEYLGPNLLQISFDIQLNSSLGVMPIASLIALKELMELHEPQRLLIGFDYFGKFVIEAMSERRKHHNGLGICISADVTLSLREAA